MLVSVSLMYCIQFVIRVVMLVRMIDLFEHDVVVMMFCCLLLLMVRDGSILDQVAMFHMEHLTSIMFRH